MAGAGVTQSVCLPLLSVYQLSTNGAIQVGAASFWVGMHQESLPCPALWAMAGVESSQFGRTGEDSCHPYTLETSKMVGRVCDVCHTGQQCK